jgi:methanethiol S-methyltransferase
MNSIGRFLILIYGLVAYAATLGSLTYAIGFLTNFYVPKTVDSGGASEIIIGLSLNAALVALFGLQHSVMARDWFKKGILKIIPQAAERSTYVLFSSLGLIVLYIFWQPLPQLLWSIDHEIVRITLYICFGVGALLVLYSSFLIDHFELFGVKQVYYYFLGREIPEKPPFKMPGLFKLVRHPLDLGFLIVFWSTPEMSVGHFEFSVLTTVYILIGTRFEERDLIRKFPTYKHYKATTPKLIPFLKIRSARQPGDG